MAKYGKRLRNINNSIDRNIDYSVLDALDILKKNSSVKFDETVDIVLNCNIEAKKTDQNVRGVVVLPKGTGKTVRLAVFARDSLAKRAKDAGADIVGSDDLIDKVLKGEIDFDRCIATTEMMPLLGKVGRILGPKGLMPNPKLGNVTNNVEDAVKAMKGGQISFSSDKGGVIHSILGKISFDTNDLKENFNALLSAIENAKPATIKKDLIKSIYMSSTMGVSLKLNSDY